MSNVVITGKQLLDRRLVEEIQVLNGAMLTTNDLNALVAEGALFSSEFTDLSIAEGVGVFQLLIDTGAGADFIDATGPADSSIALDALDFNQTTFTAVRTLDAATDIYKYMVSRSAT